MQKKKLLFVIHQLNYGGVQKAIIPALNAIDYSKYEVTLYVRKNRLELLSEINSNVSKIIINDDNTHYYRKTYMIYLQGLEIVSRLLKRKNWEETIHQKIVTYISRSKMEYEKKHYFGDEQEYDIAISFIQGYTSQFVAEYIKAKKKYMFYHVSTDEHHDIHEQSMQAFDKIVGVNENIKTILDIFYPQFSNKTCFLDNYVDIPSVREKSKRFKVMIPDSKYIICSCGRFAKVKGFDLAVKAAKVLKDKELSIHWYFVGDGPERAYLEQMIKEYHLEECITITGMQNNPYPYMAACDIYVQPSYEEAHSLTIMEALGLNRPVVTTATVGGSMLIKNENKGVIVDICGKALAEGIEKLLEKELHQKVISYLKEIDYSNDFEIYKKRWKELLEA